MDEKIYDIILSNGTEIKGLRLNGNNFISKNAVSPEVFKENCSPVVIATGFQNELHENMELVQITEMNGEYWFVLRDLTPGELTNMKMQSDIEYVAMMSGVEL
jgi:hypothetical protein